MQYLYSQVLGVFGYTILKGFCCCCFVFLSFGSSIYFRDGNALLASQRWCYSSQFKVSFNLSLFIPLSKKISIYGFYELVLCFGIWGIAVTVKIWLFTSL